MAKLQRRGIIAPHEYKAVEQADRFTITDDVVCSYCQDPVEIQDRLELRCHRHGRLRLVMSENTSDPNQTHKTMMFYFQRVNAAVEIFSESRSSFLASYKGCPFCGQNLSGQRRDVEAAEQSWWCGDCGVAFVIEFIRSVCHPNTYQMRFQPEAKYFVSEVRRSADTENRWLWESDSARGRRKDL